MHLYVCVIVCDMTFVTNSTPTSVGCALRVDFTIPMEINLSVCGIAIKFIVGSDAEMSCFNFNASNHHASMQALADRLWVTQFSGIN